MQAQRALLASTAAVLARHGAGMAKVAFSFFLSAKQKHPYSIVELTPYLQGRTVREMQAGQRFMQPGEPLISGMRIYYRTVEKDSTWSYSTHTRYLIHDTR